MTDAIIYVTLMWFLLATWKFAPKRLKSQPSQVKFRDVFFLLAVQKYTLVEAGRIKLVMSSRGKWLEPCNS